MSNTTTHIDQLNRSIIVNAFPKRIISLVPSQTELLYYLGLREEVVGITKFCIHPSEWFKNKTRVGGTKKYNFETIKNLVPDLIIGNKEENEEAQLKTLMNLYPVWMSDIESFDDALTMIGDVGKLVGKETEAENLVATILEKKRDFIKNSTPEKRKRVAYFIWQNPYMVAGQHTFINEMLQLCGFDNVFTNIDGRYPEVTEKQLKQANPEIILLSSEPFPFKDVHVESIKKNCPNAKVKIVDGELFSWYGSRMLKAFDYFKVLLNDLEN